MLSWRFRLSLGILHDALICPCQSPEGPISRELHSGGSGIPRLVQTPCPQQRHSQIAVRGRIPGGKPPRPPQHCHGFIVAARFGKTYMKPADDRAATRKVWWPCILKSRGTKQREEKEEGK